MSRLRTLASELQASQQSKIAGRSGLVGSPDDVVICCAVRTPITKAKRGALSALMPEDLLLPLFTEVLRRTGVNASKIQDVCIGNVLQPGSGHLSSRISQLLAGIPESTAVQTCNRQCSSGLQAVANIAAAIKAGYIDIGLAGGVESMSNFDMFSTLNPEKLSDKVFENEHSRKCLIPMGITSENVAEKFGIDRLRQDSFAAESQQKAAKAARLGLFNEEIVPVLVTQQTESGAKDVLVTQDDGIRANTTAESLGKLRPSFKDDGSTHAGNSSQISDGAALCLLARRSVAVAQKLPILATFATFAAVGVPPEIMGIGPAFAIPQVLANAKLNIDDVDIFEINEAFASQALYCTEKLQIPKHKLNPKGGAIAFGHPLGCTGSRQIATLLPELRRTGGNIGVVSMCVGTGMGAAAVIVLEK